MARAGAFDNLESNRACVFEGAEAIARAAQAAAEDRISNQSNLFGEADAGPNLRLPEVNSWSDAEQLSNELDAIGMYLSAHPLDAYQAQMKKLGVTSIADLLKMAHLHQPGATRNTTTSIVARKQIAELRQRNLADKKELLPAAAGSPLFNFQTQLAL